MGERLLFVAKHLLVNDCLLWNFISSEEGEAIEEDEVIGEIETDKVCEKI